MLKKKNIIKNKKQSVYNVNIDNYHQNKINNFDNEENNLLPKLEKQLATIEKGISRTKNSEKFLSENILSVKSQNYKNFEHIIVDGNSKDKTIKKQKRNDYENSDSGE